MEPLLGQIAQFPYPFVPQGWALCDGTLLSIEQNAALYSLLGSQFGGDGTRNFALPKLLPIHPQEGPELRYFIAVTGVYPNRQ